MTTISERQSMLNAAEQYKIPLPDYLTEAQTFLAAATAYKHEVAGLEEPHLEEATAHTIAETVDRVLAFGQRDERLRLACRVETIANSAYEAALGRFRGLLLTELAAPFDSAAEKYTTARAMYARQDPKVIAALTDLVRVRDALAGRVGENLPAPNLDLPTRVATFADREAIVRSYKLRTQGLERGSEKWLDALLSIPGTALRWQTPDQQRAHLAAIPAGGDSMHLYVGGDAA